MTGPAGGVPRPLRPLGPLIGLLDGRGLLRTVVPAGGSPAAVAIGAVRWDSRTTSPGDLFVALAGERLDGHDFAPDAVARGAAAVLVERALPGLRVPQLLVHGTRPAMALAAAWAAGFPSRELGVVGVTGTDGKTTTSWMVRAILEASGQPTGLLGTVDVVVGGRSLGNPGRTTTPEAPELQDHLAAMLRAGDRWAIVEASSHGLAQERPGEVAWDVAVMTNLTHEHLEFHRTHAAYRAAKRRLFEALSAGETNPQKGWGKSGVINLDDAWAGDFAVATRQAGARLLGYGAAPESLVRATHIEEDVRQLRFVARTPRWQGQVALRLAGRFNVANALAAIAVGEALDLPPEAVRAGLENLAGVPGRMERIDAGQPFAAIVDYAHTPDALAKVLDELGPLAASGGGGLIAVFGSAGERDVLKRPLMGRVAGERCRLVVLTDEDPRLEDRAAILEAIAEGAEAVGRRRGHDLLLIADRAAAIAAALDQARRGDVVLFAGKGHEKTIEMADGDRPWAEAAAVRDALRALGYSGGAG